MDDHIAASRLRRAEQREHVTGRDLAAEWSLWEESLALAERRHDGTRDRSEAWATGMRQHALSNLAHLAFTQGNHQRARVLREQSLALARARKNDLRVAFELWALGELALHTGDEAAAAAAFDELLRSVQGPEYAWIRHRAAAWVNARHGDMSGPSPDAPAAGGGNGLFVDVGGHRLYARCWGSPASAPPTVVLESGLGDNWGQWQHVAPVIGGFARAVAYSRAGLGTSEPGPLPRTCIRVAEELRALLAHLACAPPYVLVGHSIGSRTQRMFASLFPDDVAGLLLLDGHQEQSPEDHERETAHLPAEERERHDRWFSGGNPTEHFDMRTSWRQLADAERLPPVPIVCVASRWAAGNYRPDAQPTPRRKDLRDAEQAVYRHYGPTASFLVAEQSGHYIHADQPDLVIETVGAMVSSARQPRHVARHHTYD